MGVNVLARWSQVNVGLPLCTNTMWGMRGNIAMKMQPMKYQSRALTTVDGGSRLFCELYRLIMASMLRSKLDILVALFSVEKNPIQVIKTTIVQGRYACTIYFHTGLDASTSNPHIWYSSPDIISLFGWIGDKRR